MHLARGPLPGLLFLSLLSLPGAPAEALRSAPAVTGDTRRVSLNEDWRFLKADAPGAERPDFDDRGWRQLDVPHDWAIEGPFDPANGPNEGALPFFGVGWYRKHFTLAGSVLGRHVTVEFDGAMANARVWLNGHEIGARPYGYISFGFDLTPYLRFGDDDNVLAVRLAPEPASSRWYPGAGVYRHVWLEVTAPAHVERWGTFITTPRVTEAGATVVVRVEIRNDGAKTADLTVDTAIEDHGGSVVAHLPQASRAVAAGAWSTLEGNAEIPNPERWDIDRPYLYRAVTTVRDASGVLDRYVTLFGVRTLTFDPAIGFSLNGRHLKMHGVCLHHDLGPLGAAVSRRAIERQLQIMKAMGANAVRTSHNPPAPELLELADSMGLLVVAEAFDMWSRTKVPNGHGKYFAEWGERDLRDMIRRDRNHPSVVLWSIGNEILEQADPGGGAIAAHLTAICHEEDPSRLVTAGFNQLDNAIRNGLAEAVDIPGFNYQARHYERVLAEHPGWRILGTETASTVSSRGVYHLPIEKYHKHPSRQITSYDVVGPRWAYVPDFEFAVQDRLPQVLGEFVWTGFDYLGEPTPYYWWLDPPDPDDWPARSSYFGIVDLAGFPKDRYYLYQSAWTQSPMVHVLPHWNWAGHEGEPIPVVVYANAEVVELFLNGASLGTKVRGEQPMLLPVGSGVNDAGTFASRYRLMWEVPYQPGTLRAVAYRGRKPVAAEDVFSAGPPARLALVPDRTTITSDGDDLSFLTVRIEDADGHFCPTSNNAIQFNVTGPGTIAAVGNGNPATTESFQADHRSAFNGLALVVVRAVRGSAGAITVEARSPGLASARTALAAVRP
jgi:beta-galactosidase